MINPRSFYNKQLEIHRGQAKALYKRLVTLSTLRLLVFLATAVGVYVFFGTKNIVAIIIFIAHSS